VPTGFFRATEPIRTGPNWFGCGLSILGDGSDRLRSRLHLLEVEKPDRTGPLNTSRTQLRGVRIAEKRDFVKMMGRKLV
jgi:hypothetical protein